MKYIDFNDENLPIGKRKQAYIKFVVSKGTDIISAKRQANKKFGFEKKPGIFAIVKDWSERMEQRSFTGSQEIFAGYDLRKYKKSNWAEIWEEDEILKVKKVVIVCNPVLGVNKYIIRILILYEIK
jgi:hypothetical protein